MAEAVEQGIHFTFAASETSPCSHFSMLKMMKEWIEEVMVPYMKGVIKMDPDLDETQKSILLIDAYPIHTGTECWICNLSHDSECMPNWFSKLLEHWLLQVDTALVAALVWG